MYTVIDYFSIERLQKNNQFISLWSLVDDFENGHVDYTKNGIDEFAVFDNCVKYLRNCVLRPALNNEEVKCFEGVFNKAFVQSMSVKEKFEWNYHCYMTVRGFLMKSLLTQK